MLSSYSGRGRGRRRGRERGGRKMGGWVAGRSWGLGGRGGSRHTLWRRGGRRLRVCLNALQRKQSPRTSAAEKAWHAHRLTRLARGWLVTRVAYRCAARRQGPGRVRRAPPPGAYLLSASAGRATTDLRGAWQPGRVQTCRMVRSRRHCKTSDTPRQACAPAFWTKVE